MTPAASQTPIRYGPAHLQPVTRRIIGLDLGKAVDFTALTILDYTWPPALTPLVSGQPQVATRPTYHVPALKRWQLGTSYVDISAWLLKFFMRPDDEPRYGPPPVLVVDETGVGIAVAEMLRQALKGKVPGGMITVTITAGSATSITDEGRWRVAKKQLASVLVTLFQSRRLKIAPCPEREVLLKEASEFSVKITAAGNESFESWRESAHDDLVLSLALAAWAAECVEFPPWP